MSYRPPYKVYTALLSQSGTNNPTAIELENTLGSSVSFLRDGTGTYYINFNQVFPNINKIFFVLGNSSISANTNFSIERDASSPILYTYDVLSSNTSDDLLTNTEIEIRVYE